MQERGGGRSGVRGRLLLVHSGCPVAPADDRIRAEAIAARGDSAAGLGSLPSTGTRAATAALFGSGPLHVDGCARPRAGKQSAFGGRARRLAWTRASARSQLGSWCRFHVSHPRSCRDRGGERFAFDRYHPHSGDAARRACGHGQTPLRRLEGAHRSEVLIGWQFWRGAVLGVFWGELQCAGPSAGRLIGPFGRE
jgi:hypothetical protein